MKSLLLISDLDNTYVGDQPALEKLQAYLGDHRSGVYLVYSTGRSLPSAHQLQAKVGLMEPDYWVTAVGTEIFHQGQLDQGWADYLSQNWQRSAVQAIADQYSGLTLQPEQDQNPWKLSYYVDSQADPQVIADLEQALQRAGLAVQVIFSSGKDLDLLPPQSNKGNATRYLQKTLDMEPTQTLVCGDSGNDISLFETDSNGVIVSNCQPELANWYQQNGTERHFLAPVGYAAAIQAAIAHFDLL